MGIRWGKKKFAIEAPKEEPKKEEPKKEEEKKEETKKDEVKKDDEKKEESKDAEKKDETKVEEKKVEDKPAEVNLIDPLKSLVQYVKWEQGDAAYYLKEIRGKPILSMEAENNAMTQMLQAFVDNSQKAPQQSSSQAAKAAAMGPKSTQQAAAQRGRQQGQKRDNSQECEVITERISKNSRTTQRVKEE